MAWLPLGLDPWTWVLGCITHCLAGLPWASSHSLGLALPLAPGLSSPLKSKALTLFTLELLAWFSPSNRPPFRVGFAGELLLVVGYAWTPSLQETVVVSWLGLLSNSLAR